MSLPEAGEKASILNFIQINTSKKRKVKQIPYYTIKLINGKRLKKKSMFVVKLSSPKTGSRYTAKLAFGVNIRNRVPKQ